MPTIDPINITAALNALRACRRGLLELDDAPLEAVVRGCDHAVKQAKAIGDDGLVRVVIERGQAMIDSIVAQVFIDRWFAKQKAPAN